MVGRFVEDEQIGVGNQHRGQRHTFALTAGKQSHGLVEFIDFELRENLLGAQLDIVPFLIGVEGGGVRLEFAAFFGDEQGSVFCTQTTGHGLQHGHFGIEIRLLLEHAHAQTFLEHNVAAVGTVFTCDQSEEGRFAGSVARDQTDVLPFGHTERDVFEQHQVADAFRQILDVEIGSRHTKEGILQAKVQKNKGSFRPLP